MVLLESKWLRLAYVLNKIAGFSGKSFIPPELARFLPVIDISEVLDAYGFVNELEIPAIPEDILGVPAFQCLSQEVIGVEAGVFSSFNISVVDGRGSIYYSPEAKTIVRAAGNFKDIFPFMEDIDIELIDIEIG
jgi:hypothetical protein